MNFSVAAMLLLGGLSQVHSHATAIRRCITSEGNLRIFVAHWHHDKFGEVVTTSNAGTTTIQQNHLFGAPSITLPPTGVVANTAPGLLPGCASPDVLVATCQPSNHDWVWYDFPLTCNIPLDYTFLSGNTVILTEDCSNLYPSNVQATFLDTAPPVIKIDGNPCQDHIVIAQTTNDCVNLGVATWETSAQDDCDSAPTLVSSSHTSGITMFPIGDTTVTVVYEDNTDKTTTCTFTVSMSGTGDTEDPTLTCPADMDQNTDQGLCTAAVTYTTPAGQDNCEVDSTVVTGFGSGHHFSVGTTTESYTTTDTAGLTATCSFGVTVSDNEPPHSLKIDGETCEGHIVHARTTDACSNDGVVEWVPSAQDNCGSDPLVLTSSPDSGGTFSVGDTSVTTTYQDTSFNSASCSFTVRMVSIGSCAGPPVDLGTAGEFAILSKSGVTTTGTTYVIGDMGTSPIAATALTGFALVLDSGGTFSTSSLIVTGSVYAADYEVPTPTKMTTAVFYMEAAYTDTAGRVGPGPVEVGLGGGDLSGMTLEPGIYKWSTTVGFTDTLTFNGTSTDIWILQIAGTFTAGPGAKVELAGDAKAENIYWAIAGVVAFDDDSNGEGIFLAQTMISFNAGSSLSGAALAQTEVTMISANIIGVGM